MTSRRTSTARPAVQRLLDRLTAVIVISLVAVSGGLLLELNQKAQAEARVTPFEQPERALG